MNTHSYTRPLALALVLAASTSGLAYSQVTEDVTVSATLNNALALSEDTPMDFGTLTFIPGGVANGTVAIAMSSADGSYGGVTLGASATGNILPISGATPGAYSISTGITGFTDVDISFPKAVTTSATLVASGVPGGNGSIIYTVGTPTIVTGSVSTPCADTGSPVATFDCTYQTDGNGDIAFTLGGTLTLADDGTYQSTTTVYTGTMTVSVNFG